MAGLGAGTRGIMEPSSSVKPARKVDLRTPADILAAVNLTGVTAISLQGRRNCPRSPASFREAIELSARKTLFDRHER